MRTSFYPNDIQIFFEFRPHLLMIWDVRCWVRACEPPLTARGDGETVGFRLSGCRAFGNPERAKNLQVGCQFADVGGPKFGTWELDQLWLRNITWVLSSTVMPVYRAQPPLEEGHCILLLSSLETYKIRLSCFLSSSTPHD